MGDIIRELVPQFLRLYNLASVREINEGYCEVFAKEVCRIHPDAEPLWDNDMPGGPRWGTHCFVRHEEMYYDSECPDGCSDWKQLPSFRRES